MWIRSMRWNRKCPASAMPVQCKTQESAARVQRRDPGRPAAGSLRRGPGSFPPGAGAAPFRCAADRGCILHRGNIAEMRTGEGKTLVATLPAYLNALEGKGVHVVTVNDYLARRDSEDMGRVYRFLGLSVGVDHPRYGLSSCPEGGLCSGHHLRHQQ